MPNPKHVSIRQALHSLEPKDPTDHTLFVNSAYHPDLPEMARRLGGLWRRPYWIFDYREEENVRRAYRQIFGTDGDDAPELVTVLLNFVAAWRGAVKPGFVCLDRQIVYRRGMLEEFGVDVVPREGDIAVVKAEDGIVLEISSGSSIEVRDVPRDFADSFDVPGCRLEIIGGPEKSLKDVQAARNALAVRIRELDELIDRLKA